MLKFKTMKTTPEQWRHYWKLMEAWRQKYAAYDTNDSTQLFEMMMMKPNRPGYYRANND